MRFLRISVGLTRTDTVRLCKKRIVFTFIVFLSVFSNRDIMLTITVKKYSSQLTRVRASAGGCAAFPPSGRSWTAAGPPFPNESSCVILVSLDGY